MPVPSPSRRVQFGDFDLDVESGELTHNGTRVLLQLQSLELLKALLEQPGQMVSRDELRRRLWPADTFVDFEHGLNAAVRRLREVLGDTADTPRFIETIPRRGYRLVVQDAPAAPAAPAAPVATSPTAVAAPLVDGARDIPDAAMTSGRRPNVGVGVAVGVALTALLTVLSTGAWLAGRRSAPPARPPVATFTVDVPAGWSMRVLDLVAVSPDSRTIAFTAVDADGRRALWVRPLGGGTVRRIVTEGNPLYPFWSPDSSRIGFFQPAQLTAVRLADASTQVLTVLTPPQSAPDTASLSKLDVSDPLLGGAATWMDNGDVLFTRFHRLALQRLTRGGGAPVPLASGRGSDLRSGPEAIPGTDRFTAVDSRRLTVERFARVGVLAGTQTIDLRGVESRVVATTSGHAVFVRDGALVAQRLDARRGFIGDATVLADDVPSRQPLLGHFSATSDVLAYLTSSALRLEMQMLMVDRRGVELGRVGRPGFYSNLKLSPDGARAAVALEDARLGTRDLWIYDLAGKPPLRLTFDPADDAGPAWSRDGRTILFNSDRNGERDLYRKTVTAGEPETLIFASPDSKSINDWSPDGRYVVYDTGARGSLDAAGRFNRADLFVVSLDGHPRQRPLASTLAHEAIADISPDGTLVAYHSSENGSTEVFVETFPDKRGRWQVTTTGGLEPMWRADGRELFFLTDRSEVASVEVLRSPDGIRFGPPRVLFTRPNGPIDQVRSYAAVPDGQRFLILAPVTVSALQQITVRVNWRSGLPVD